MIKRRTFVGLAAGAAAGIAVANADNGYTVVSEDDPAISVSRITVSTSDGAVPAYSAVPINATPKTPGIVAVMHLWGVDESIRETVRALAKNGFAAVAPDLYARMNAPNGDGATDYTKFMPFATQLNPEQVDRDLAAAAAWLREGHAGAKIGITGWCMGGTIALRQTIDNASVFSAGAVWYGRVQDRDPARVGMPLLGSYGELDTGIPAQDVRTFFAALRVPHELKIYPDAGHAFFDRTRPSYVSDAASDAWARTLRFFAKYL